MSSRLEHRECSEALGAYALGALSDAEAGRVQRHLSECHECRTELGWLRAGVDVLPASVPQIDPPPELRQRLMEIVTSEAELLRAAGPPADQPPPPARRRRWLPAGKWLPGLGVATACLAVFAIVLAITGGGTSTRTIRAQLVPALAGRMRAQVVVRGNTAELVVRGMPAPAANHVDELWVQRGSAPPSPAGTFIVHTGSVHVAHSVKRGDLVMVTVEPGRGTTAPTTKPLIVAKV